MHNMQLPKTRQELARFIDHTLLKPEATVEQVDRLCDECIAHGFAAVCVNPVWIGRCADRLAHHDAAVATVAGFPLGASLAGDQGVRGAAGRRARVRAKSTWS